MTIFLFSIRLSIILTIFICSSFAFAEQPSEVKRTAYCKINKNRIMIFQFSGLPSSKEMIEYLKNHKPMHSDHRMTAAYYFPKGSRMPQSGYSSCRSIDQANQYLYENLDIDQWEFVYMVSFNGSKTFVNCLESTNHDLCR